MAGDRFQKTLWAILVLTLIGVGAAYFVLESRRVDLPVIGTLKPFTLTNQLGAPVTSETLRGQVVVANVIFSRCPTLCHRLAQQMSRVQKEIPTGVRLLSLTADPGYDTPEVLKKHGERFQNDPDKWWFLTGPKAEVYGVATNSLLFPLMENPDPANAKLEDLFIHSADFRIVDRQGRLRAVVDGEDTNAITRIVTLVKQLRREPSL